MKWLILSAYHLTILQANLQSPDSLTNMMLDFRRGFLNRVPTRSHILERQTTQLQISNRSSPTDSHTVQHSERSPRTYMLGGMQGCMQQIRYQQMPRAFEVTHQPSRLAVAATVQYHRAPRALSPERKRQGGMQAVYATNPLPTNA
jgi:hypothetical protein